MFRPRQTIRRIIDSDPDWFVRTLFLLAIVSAIVKDFDLQGFDELTAMPPSLLAINIVAGVVLGILFMLLAYYILSWSATLVGTWLGGTGTFREVRAAIAWGLAPLVWALIYRVPAMVIVLITHDELGPPQLLIDDGRIEWREGTFGAFDLTWFLLLILLDFAVLLWYLLVASRTLGEAHRVSSWKGFGTLVLAFIFPIAAIGTLAFVTWLYVDRVGG